MNDSQTKDQKSTEQTNKMSFGAAVSALKSGRNVQREGWNGKNMHLYLEEHFSAVVGMGGAKHERQYEPVICMYTAQGKHQPGWLASQADILAEDWQLV